MSFIYPCMHITTDYTSASVTAKSQGLNMLDFNRFNQTISWSTQQFLNNILDVNPAEDRHAGGNSDESWNNV